MTEREVIDQFLAQENLAVFGVSRGGKKFGNAVYKDLKEKGWNVFAVNPNSDEIEGDKCYRDINGLPEKVTGAVLCIQPEESSKVVKNLFEKGITNIWLQQGAESKEAVSFCEENKMNIVYGRCVMMFSEPVKGGHKIHRWVNKVFGKMPE